MDGSWLLSLKADKSHLLVYHLFTNKQCDRDKGRPETWQMLAHERKYHVMTLYSEVIITIWIRLAKIGKAVQVKLFYTCFSSLIFWGLKHVRFESYWIPEAALNQWPEKGWNFDIDFHEAFFERNFTKDSNEQF